MQKQSIWWRDNSGGGGQQFRQVFFIDDIYSSAGDGELFFVLLTPKIFKELESWDISSPSLGRNMTQSGNERAVALFGHLKERTGLNMPPLGASSEVRDASWNDINVFASDREITVTDADA
ncbi:MAG: hypothetical protein EZS28_026121 [Streblomastix strix]|uniref:Uncharacterized protein n=1 Tax=Streblomastix strix TaxID=222440 RepID=A0A5J4V7C0_9EUKA|nr:MAG: hypothetical protein EZS28_026121 [Streblomastix strix]